MKKISVSTKISCFKESFNKDLLWLIGSGALSGKMLVVRIIKNIKLYAYFRSGYVK